MSPIDTAINGHLIVDTSSDLAERHRPESPCTTETQQEQPAFSTLNTLDRLQQVERSIPHQEFEEACLLACLERHKGILSTDPRSMSAPGHDHASCPETSDDEFWQCMIQDYRLAVTHLPRLTAHTLRRGVPAQVRGDVWQSAVEGRDIHLEALYEQLLGDHDAKDVTPYARDIERDARQQDDDTATQEQMIRILKAYSTYDGQVGYCPGLIHLVRTLLLTMPEHSAFCTLVRLMQLREVRSLYTLNMVGLQLRLHQFQILFSQQCPVLERHLATFSIRPSMYASQWYLSLFASALPTHSTLRVFDLVFLHGMDAVTRVALAHLKRHEARLLAMDRFESLLAFLSSPSVDHEDEQGLWEDALALCSEITPQKLEQIAATQHKEWEQTKSCAQQVLSTRFLAESSATSERSSMAKLHQQIEDLVTALSHLQKEHSQLVQETTTLKARDEEHSKLLKRNAVLEKRVKKYKAKLARLTPDSEKKDTDIPGDQHASFVESLRLSGQFGTLVASALTHIESPPPPSTVTSVKKRTRPASQHGHPVSKVMADHGGDAKHNDTAELAQLRRHSTEGLSLVTSELVAVKLANFEMGQKYEQLCHKYETATQQLQTMQGDQKELVDKLADLQHVLEMHQSESDELLRENEELIEKALAAKKISDELQTEKLDLAKEIEKLECTIKTLEEEKMEYLKPRDTFAEEVFAAHRVFFGPRPATSASPTGTGAQRRHTLQPVPRGATTNNVGSVPSEYRAKYIESDLQCRELEKLLAEAKLKLVEYESASTCGSPRASFQHPYRPMSLQMKRQSAASLSMLASRTSTSPHSRLSTDSFASSVTSVTSLGSSQRSSMYARLWTALGSTQPPKHMQGDPLSERSELAQTADH